ncbi:unnamed protein product [Phytophthora fragariaefolia]|uniref:Unnamed protein product n=1 Tax=Phytophthora fragariaefolia TaxID=1490495 RepID=A0A9W6U3B1_9STRA|nr:unnamed protein product [Phytophthora fragariaefolia]
MRADRSSCAPQEQRRIRVARSRAQQNAGQTGEDSGATTTEMATMTGTTAGSRTTTARATTTTQALATTTSAGMPALRAPSSLRAMDRELKPWDLYDLSGAESPESLATMKTTSVGSDRCGERMSMVSRMIHSSGRGVP